MKIACNQRVACNQAWRGASGHVVDVDHSEGFDPGAVRDGDVIFVKTELLDPFVMFLVPRLAGRRDLVLVSGRSDLSPGAFASAVVHCSGLFRAWYAVNLPAARFVQTAPGPPHEVHEAHEATRGVLTAVPTPLARGLPLGVPEPAGGDFQAALTAARVRAAGRPRAGIVLPAARPTHPVRAAVAAWAAGDDPVAGRVTVRPWTDTAGYLDDLAAHAYALCPRGNGIDVHRAWEAVLMGCVPLYVSDDPPPAAFARLCQALPAARACAPADLSAVVGALPPDPALPPEAWAAARELCLAAPWVSLW